MQQDHAPASVSPGQANPTTCLRRQADLSVDALAAALGVSRAVVKWTEHGCYNIIPTCYKTYFPILLDPLNAQAYQTFRKQKRQVTFSGWGVVPRKALVFPEKPSKNIQELLSHFGLKPYGLATKACLQHAEVFALMQNRKVNLSVNFIQFFEQVGLTTEWIEEFGYNINATRLIHA